MKLIGVRGPQGDRLEWHRGFTLMGRKNDLDYAKHILKTLVINIPKPPVPTRPLVETRKRADGSTVSLGLDSFDRAISQCLDEIDEESTLSADAVARIITPVAERMHRMTAAALPAAPINRYDVPRIPSDCLAHWMDVVDQTYGSLPKNSVHRRAELGALEGEARSIWLSHSMNARAMGDYFKAQANSCERAQLPELAKLARSLHRELSYTEVQATLPQQYDNHMARAWESSLIRALVENPPPGVTKSANRLAEAHYTRLKSLSRSDSRAWKKVARDVQRQINNDNRFWTSKVRRLQDFADAPEDRCADALLKYLSLDLTSGEDCVSIHYLTVKISKALKNHAPEHIHWDLTPQDKADFKQRDAARAIIKKDGYIGQGSGIMLAHQPAMERDAYANHLWDRPATRNRPNMARPSTEVERALDKGAPYVSGPSGSAGFIAKAIDYFNKGEDARIDRAHAMLGASMFLLFDGGHSIHEVMWELNLLKPRIDMRIGGPHVAPQEFIGNYDDFFNAFRFSDTTTRHLQRAENRAFKEMLNHRRQNLGPLLGSQYEALDAAYRSGRN